MSRVEIQHWSYTKLPNSELTEPYPDNHRVEIDRLKDNIKIIISGVIIDGNSESIVCPKVWTHADQLFIELKECKRSTDSQFVQDLRKYVVFEMEVEFVDDLPANINISYEMVNGNSHSIMCDS
jgi:hypothetical protein